MWLPLFLVVSLFVSVRGDVEVNPLRGKLSTVEASLVKCENNLRDVESSQRTAHETEVSSFKRKLAEADNALAAAKAAVSSSDSTAERNALSKKIAAMETEAKATIAKHSALEKELQVMKKLHTEIDNENKELKSKLENTVKQSTTEFSAKIDELKSSVTSCQASLKSETSRLTEEMSRVESKLASKANEFETVSSQLAHHKTKMGEIEREASLCATELKGLRADMMVTTKRIYSAVHFWRTYEHTKELATAFTLYMREWAKRMVGKDTWEMITLQTRVWLDKAEKVTMAHKEKLMVYYNAHLAEHVTQAMQVISAISEKPIAISNVLYKQLLDLGLLAYHKSLSYVEAYMERVVRNLSSVSPSTRELFPEDFYNRCFAFAFISIIVYAVSTACSHLFNVLVAAPFEYLFSSKTKTANIKKRKVAPSTTKSAIPNKSTASVKKTTRA